MYTVKLFAILAEQVGQAEVQLQLPTPITAGAVKAAMQAAFPQTSSVLADCLVAVNQTFIDQEEFAPSEVTELALIPPVSGG
ncbi:MoaD/ThiS family protein [Loigolactobacillus binensis]|uniref:Molybdopterin synthase sulfur carrier subunit n=1 Tax=Loigolactobacillus binensis TaxID=2559922 RepID=A0ABW3EB22_9LACO|nr:MoaD/ThiS family protein [Loigolactobacillus binensis]